MLNDSIDYLISFLLDYWPYLLGVGLFVVPAILALTPIGGPKLRRSFVTAVRNLWLHKLRSFLSVLGIIIGTASVIALMAFGEGSMQDALDDIMRQGATNIIVVSVKPADGATSNRSFVAKYGLTYQDYERFRTTIPNLVSAPLPVRSFDAVVRPVTESKVLRSRVVATTPHYATIYKLGDMIAAGRFIVEADESPVPRNICVLGSEVARTLYPGEDPINKVIRFEGKNPAFTIVGVLKDRSPSTSGPDIEKYDTDIYIPLVSSRALLGDTTFLRSSGQRGAEQVQLSQIIMTVETMEQVRPTAEIAGMQLDLFHDAAKKDWNVKVPLDKLEDAERTRDRYRRQMAMIAGISLLVGGIGIMNIMLATVTERTREIGIRRALGAKRSDVTFQFLVEALVQTTLGGLIGVGFGFLIIWLAPPIGHYFSNHLPTKVHQPSVFMAFFAAVVVGVLFGWYPSRRAARLDPIEALRHE
ncbi:MAG TPA: ABC transporter permease [Gemmatales bacterium]|nr:ABC transporter permease [Gemmatales bacterium]